MCMLKKVSKRSETAVKASFEKLINSYLEDEFNASYFYKKCIHCGHYDHCEAADGVLKMIGSELDELITNKEEWSINDILNMDETVDDLVKDLIDKMDIQTKYDIVKKFIREIPKRNMIFL